MPYLPVTVCTFSGSPNPARLRAEGFVDFSPKTVKPLFIEILKFHIAKKAALIAPAVNPATIRRQAMMGRQIFMLSLVLPGFTSVTPSTTGVSKCQALMLVVRR